jgi:hypothetical protein
MQAILLTFSLLLVAAMLASVAWLTVVRARAGSDAMSADADELA